MVADKSGTEYPNRVYSPPYPELNDALPRRISSQSHSVCRVNPYLSPLASAPCYPIFLLICPLRFSGV